MTHWSTDISTAPRGKTVVRDVPESVLKAARNAFPWRKLNAIWERHTPGAERDLRTEIFSALIEAITEERRRCAEIADKMRVKHGSPVMGPYENGNWDQGKRIADLVRDTLGTPEHPFNQSDVGVVAEVKAKSRLANADSVEPPASGLIVHRHIFLDDAGSGV